MHSIPELGSNVPAFLAKLWKLVDDPETDDLICWSPNGRSFFIRNQAQFARELLPHYYKHNNMASFVRQLNMYGFHKKVSVELGGLKCDRDEMEFAHQFFSKGHPYLIDHIKRKIASSKGQDTTLAPIKSELMNKMLNEVRSMRGRQEHLDSKLGTMKRENEALWRELAMLRQKHMKQQQIVNKLISFLVTLVQPTRSNGLPVKRRLPLMINDSNRQRKQTKMSKQSSPVGPVIHELDSSDPDMDSEYIVAEMLEGHTAPDVESPKHDNSLMEDNNIETVHIINGNEQLQNEVQLVASQEVETKKKRGCKGKKKEETHLLEIPLEDDEPVSIALLENKKPSKSVPVATVRSSKLAAMAANMSNNTELDLEASTDMDEDIQEDDSSLVNFETVMLIPDEVNEQVEENENPIEEYAENTDNLQTNYTVNDVNELVKETASNEQDNRNEESSVNSAQKSPEQKQTIKSDETNQNNSKNLSLSCIVSDTSKLGLMEEITTHVDTTQTQLENFLQGNFDANAILSSLQLFGDDALSFGFPINSELNLHSEKEEDNNVTENINGIGGGELMAYNTNQPFDAIDLEDEIFKIGAAASPISNTDDATTSSLYSSDPLDNKISFLESLTNDINNTS